LAWWQCEPSFEGLWLIEISCIQYPWWINNWL
jgi:hypothetical protein